jgi:hypothetical protein
VGAAPPAAVTDTRSHPVLIFRDLAWEQLPRLLSLARRLVSDDAEGGSHRGEGQGGRHDAT